MTDSQLIGRWKPLPSGFFRVYPGGKAAYVANDVGTGAHWWLTIGGVTVEEGPATDAPMGMAAAHLLMLELYNG